MAHDPVPDTSGEPPVRRRATRSCSSLGLLAVLAGCGAPPPETLGPTAAGLAPCPDAPNCVHTGDGYPEGVPAFLLTAEWLGRVDGELWSAIEDAVASLPRTDVIRRTEEYLHAESTSLIFRFVDDLEIYRAPGDPELVVRSESRVGRSDRGVNLRRVEELRQALQERGVVR